jgi:uncharacterized protein YndB with AHSA1/START domain
MPKSKFVYVIFIRTTPERLWQALTTPEFNRQFFYGTIQESEWKKGAKWRLVKPDGGTCDSGEVLEIDPPRRLVLKWRNEFIPEMRAEGYSRMTCEIESQGASVKLTIIHEMDKPRSKLIESVSQGWPSILSSLKSLLETGESLEETRQWPEEFN